MSDRAAVLIRNWAARLQDDLLLPQVLAALHEREGDIQRCALDGLQRENPAFQRAASEQFRKEAIGHCNAIGEVMFGVLSSDAAGLGPDPFGFVRTHAVRRARQQFPLAGSLNAYRLAHRGYWTVLRELLLGCAADDQERNACSMLLSEFLLEFFDLVSSIMTDAYMAEETRILSQRDRARIALIEDLLHGRPPGDVEARELCDRCGIRDGMRIAVAVVRPLHRDGNNTAEQEARLDRLPELVESSLSKRGLGTLVDRRDGAVVAIAAGPSDSARITASALRTSFAAARDSAAFPLAIGVGLEATEIAAVPQAFSEAERAIAFAEPRRTVVHLAEVDLVRLLQRHPDAAALRLIPEWAGRLREADGKKSGNLLRTIRVFADCDLNVKRTARSLKLHTNTVYFRLNSVKKLTGVDPRSFAGATLLLTALSLLEAKNAAQ